MPYQLIYTHRIFVVVVVIIVVVVVAVVAVCVSGINDTPLMCFLCSLAHVFYFRGGQLIPFVLERRA